MRKSIQRLLPVSVKAAIMFAWPDDISFGGWLGPHVWRPMRQSHSGPFFEGFGLDFTWLPQAIIIEDSNVGVILPASAGKMSSWRHLNAGWKQTR